MNGHRSSETCIRENTVEFRGKLDNLNLGLECLFLHVTNKVVATHIMKQLAQKQTIRDVEKWRAEELSRPLPVSPMQGFTCICCSLLVKYNPFWGFACAYFLPECSMWACRAASASVSSISDITVIIILCLKSHECLVFHCIHLGSGCLETNGMEKGLCDTGPCWLWLNKQEDT